MLQYIFKTEEKVENSHAAEYFSAAEQKHKNAEKLHDSQFLCLNQTHYKWT